MDVLQTRQTQALAGRMSSSMLPQLFGEPQEGQSRPEAFGENDLRKVGKRTQMRDMTRIPFLCTGSSAGARDEIRTFVEMLPAGLSKNDKPWRVET